MTCAPKKNQAVVCVYLVTQCLLLATSDNMCYSDKTKALLEADADSLSNSHGAMTEWHKHDTKQGALVVVPALILIDR